MTKHETKLKLSQKAPIELAAFLNGARETWQTPQGGLLPSERAARLAFFEKAAAPEAVDQAGDDPGVMIDAFADLSREEFLDLLLGNWSEISLEALQSKQTSL